MNTQGTNKGWNETKSKIKARFGKLTDSSIESARENLDLLVEKIQSAYGFAKGQAERDLKAFRETLNLVMAEPVPVPVPVSAKVD